MPMVDRFLSYLLIILTVRALYYTLRIRRNVVAYGIKALIEIGFFLLLFDVSLLTALTGPGLIILLNLFLYVFEIHVTESFEEISIRLFRPPVVVGLLLYSAAFALFLFSESGPELRKVFTDVVSGKVLLIVTVGLIATFETGHFVDGIVGAGERLLIYLFAVQGLFLAAAVVILAKGIVLAVPQASRRGAGDVAASTGTAAYDGVASRFTRAGVNRSILFVGPALAVIAGIITRTLV